MNRNTEQHFANTPTVDIGRSKFERPFDHKTSFNTGEIIPVYCEQVIPGDTIKMRTSSVVRMMTPIVPVMDNAHLDLMFFFVPWRLIWKHTKQFVGENDTSPWKQEVEYEIPQIKAPSVTGWAPKTLADYLGVPTGVPRLSSSALPFRAYACIYNNWFRSEVVTTPVYMHDDDATTEGLNYEGNETYYDPVRDTERGAKPLRACKYFDYFTGALPEAQKGNPVTLPVGNSAPIKFGVTGLPSNIANSASNSMNEKTAIVRWSTEVENNTANFGEGLLRAKMTDSSTGAGANNQYSSLYADLSSATGATVIQLRQAFAIQKFYERAGLVGSRYGEVIRGHFGVVNPDYRNQIPEYLGGTRTPISINQVVQTSATNETSPQGNTAAYSVSVDRNDDMWTKSFTEWGIVMGLAVVRHDTTYQQGLNREWSKKKFTDFYWPEFANLSNQSILLKELYAQGPSVVNENGVAEDDEAFGYQEAWAEMRYSPNRVSAELRSNYPQSLDVWTWADYYTEKPTLSTGWLEQGDQNMARSLAVQDHNQFFGDFYFGAVWTRPMPVYSIPGLIDHH